MGLNKIKCTECNQGEANHFLIIGKPPLPHYLCYDCYYRLRPKEKIEMYCKECDKVVKSNRFLWDDKFYCNKKCLKKAKARKLRKIKYVSDF